MAELICFAAVDLSLDGLFLPFGKEDQRGSRMDSQADSSV